ncbi:MAG: hypothetical protein NXI10_04305 [bacterium]|nr:hypothetical protein [bacterium]
MSAKFKRQITIWDVLDIISWLVLLTSFYFTDFQYHLYAISVYLIVRGFLRRTEIKKDLKNAVDYCRVKYSLFSMIKDIVLVVVVCTAFAFGFKYIEPYLPKIEILNFGHLIVTGLIYSLLIVRLQNFTKGVRWYVSGIKLPGERSLLIPWRHVSEVKADGGYIYITVLGKEYKFDIHPKDYRSALHFQRWYEKKTSSLED